VDWFHKWLDINDSSQPNEDGFRGVVHSVVQPERMKDYWFVPVDFGTAPIQAFAELVEVFKGIGTKAMIVKSRNFLRAM
jgi:hypothetical protein